MPNYQGQYENAKAELLKDDSINADNRKLFVKFFEYQEYKLKRKNNLRALDTGCYRTLYGYVCKLKIVNTWFQNKPWKKLTKEDIKKVYDDLEDGTIKKENGKPYENLDTSYYSKVFKSKPFELAGKLELAQEVIQYNGKHTKEVRFILEDDFRKIMNNVNKPVHKLLLWLAWDIGENINALLQLRKNDFTKELNPYTKEPEYRVNLKRDILKRSRKARSEITNYQDTVKLLDQELANIKDNNLLFDFGYRNAKKIIDRPVQRAGVKCIPNGEKVTWKDLRSGMACDLLKKGWTSDEVNARLGHKPSSDEIDKYINFLAIDRHLPKKKVHQFEMEKLNEQLQEVINKEKLEAKRNELLQERLEQQEKQMAEMKKDQKVFLERIAKEFLEARIKDGSLKP